MFTRVVPLPGQHRRYSVGLAVALLFAPMHCLAWPANHSLFGYPGTPQHGMQLFPQWLSVLERHPVEDRPEPDCGAGHQDGCRIADWRGYLDTLRHKPLREQLSAVNRYGNHSDYVLDMVNYGMEDYWAVVREFVYNGGDCEDYAIAKLLSLRYLGLAPEQARIVVLMDSNLGVAHAVLAVDTGEQVLILDNQADEMLSDRAIVHYIPVFSINELDWWVHTPPSG